MKTLIAVATQCNQSSFKNTRLSKSLTHHEENTITTFDFSLHIKTLAGYVLFIITTLHQEILKNMTVFYLYMMMYLLIA